MVAIIHPQDCPKFCKCNAPICSLDRNMLNRVMLPEDAVCYYLLEASKADAEAIFRGLGREELFVEVSKAIPVMSVRWGRIRRKIESARKSGSRMTTLPPRQVQGGLDVRPH